MKESERTKTKKTPSMLSGHHKGSPAEQLSPAEVTPEDAAKTQKVSRLAKTS